MTHPQNGTSSAEQGKRFKRAIGAVGVVCLLSALGAALGHLNGRAPGPKSAEIPSETGSMEADTSGKSGIRVGDKVQRAEVSLAGDGKWEPAQSGTDLPAGSLVRTGSPGKAALMLEGGGTLEIGSTSEARVEMTAAGLRVKLLRGVVDFYFSRESLAPASRPSKSGGIRRQVVASLPKARKIATEQSNELREGQNYSPGLYRQGNVCEARFPLEESVGAPRLVNEADATKIHETVLSVKTQLLKWMHLSSFAFEPHSVRMLEKRIADMHVRYEAGVPVGMELIEEDNGHQFVRLGPAFAVVLNANAARAHFELTRIVLLSVSPCAFFRENHLGAWDLLTMCLMGGKTEELCVGEKAEETAWSVSTSVAVALGGAGCALDRAEREKARVCYDKVFHHHPENADSATYDKVFLHHPSAGGKQ